MNDRKATAAVRLGSLAMLSMLADTPTTKVPDEASEPLPLEPHRPRRAPTPALRDRPMPGDKLLAELRAKSRSRAERERQAIRRVRAEDDGPEAA